MESIDFLQKFIQPRPGMYLTSPKLFYLRIFLTGFQCASSGDIPEKKDRFFDQFHGWFVKRTKCSPSNVWYPFILEECQLSEEAALQRFWEYLDEFDLETRDK